MWKTKQMIGSYTLLMIIYLHLLVFMYHFYNICTTPLLIIHMYHFQTWILPHFPHISSWSYVLTYNEDMSCASTFAQLGGNQAMESLWVYLDYLVGEDIHLQAYIDHHQTRPLDYIVFYSRWLVADHVRCFYTCLSVSCGSSTTCSFFP